MENSSPGLYSLPFEISSELEESYRKSLEKTKREALTRIIQYEALPLAERQQYKQKLEMKIDSLEAVESQLIKKKTALDKKLKSAMKKSLFYKSVYQ